MNGLDIRHKNYTAQLADDFNRFYLKITDKSLDQIGNYKIIEEIGEGSFGKAYLAQHVLLNTPVVLKLGLIDDPNIVREIYYHKQLKHRNIVKLYEVIKTETRLWLVMEYCQGNELYYHIYENRKLDYKQTQNLFFQIIQAIKYVHLLNLAHRDLKLENILLADKKRTVIKLTDFGFVREFNPVSRKLLLTMCGTTVYMAPEVLKNMKYNGFTSDIWSLGIILYTMLHGQMPFEEDDELKTKYKIIHEEPTYMDFVPAPAIALMKKLLQKDPLLRPNLNEVLNSEFLIDITNKFPTERKRLLEGDSAVLINQYYNSGLPPFQSKTVKHLMKNLPIAGIRTDVLRKDVESGEMNSLTAYFDILLGKEFLKKKKKRRRSAKKSLSKSKRRVKSALLFDESQPLERIISSLSINSRTQSKTSIARRSSDRKRSVDVVPDAPAESLTLVDAPLEINVGSTPPLNRTVSFYPEGRRSSISSAISSSISERKLKHGPRNNKLMTKLQFWKKKEELGLLGSPINGSTSVADEKVNKSLTLSPNTTAFSPRNSSVASASPRQQTINNGAAPISSIDKPSSSKQEYRHRPSSMISQVSQVSQISQLSTMISELGSEMLVSDSDFDEEEELYESSSLNTSTHEVSTRYRNKRPSYRRQVSSDILIASASTSTPSRHPSTHKHPGSLSQVLSNSSDESELLLPIVSTKVSDKAKLTTTGKLAAPTASPSFVFGRSGSPVNASFPIQRSASPPAPVGKTVKALTSSEKLKMYGINEEENEDENSL